MEGELSTAAAILATIVARVGVYMYHLAGGTPCSEPIGHVYLSYFRKFRPAPTNFVSAGLKFDLIATSSPTLGPHNRTLCALYDEGLCTKIRYYWSSRLYSARFSTQSRNFQNSNVERTKYWIISKLGHSIAYKQRTRKKHTPLCAVGLMRSIPVNLYILSSPELTFTSKINMY